MAHAGAVASWWLALTNGSAEDSRHRGHAVGLGVGSGELELGAVFRRYFGASTDARRSVQTRILATMPESYAAIWCRASEPIAVGRVEVALTRCCCAVGEPMLRSRWSLRGDQSVRFAAARERVHDLKTMMIATSCGGIRCGSPRVGVGDARETGHIPEAERGRCIRRSVERER